MKKTLVFINEDGEHIIFTDTRSEKISRAFMGWIYYLSYGMPMSLGLGIFFYIGCIWFGTSDHSNTFGEAFLFCLGARTIWHHITFEESLSKHLTKLGFKKTSIPEVYSNDVSTWIENTLKGDPSLKFHGKSGGCIVLMRGNHPQLLFTVKQNGYIESPPQQINRPESEESATHVEKSQPVSPSNSVSKRANPSTSPTEAVASNSVSGWRADETLMTKIYAKVASEIGNGKIDAGLMLRVKVENPNANNVNDLYASRRVSQYLEYFARRHAETERIGREKREEEKRIEQDEKRRQALEFKKHLFNSTESNEKLNSFCTAIDTLDNLKSDRGGAVLTFLYLCLAFGLLLYFGVFNSTASDMNLAKYVAIGLEGAGFIWLVYVLENRRAKIKEASIDALVSNHDHVKKMFDWGHEDAKRAIERIQENHPEIELLETIEK